MLLLQVHLVQLVHHPEAAAVRVVDLWDPVLFVAGHPVLGHPASDIGLGEVHGLDLDVVLLVRGGVPIDDVGHDLGHLLVAGDDQLAAGHPALVVLVQGEGGHRCLLVPAGLIQFFLDYVDSSRNSPGFDQLGIRVFGALENIVVESSHTATCLLQIW